MRVGFEDVQAQLAAVSGDQAFAADFVKRYVAGTEKIDYAPLLLRAGFVLRKKAGPGSLGPLRLTKDGNVLRVATSTIIGSPAYNAGIDRDDEILSVAGISLAVPDDLAKAVGSHKAGDSVEIVFRRRGQEVRATATLAEAGDLELVTLESTGGAPSPEQTQFRQSWLGSKAN